MATLRVIVAPDPTALLEEATDTLFSLGGKSGARPAHSSWLVLRQGGLRDDVNALAAAHGVAERFDSPVCLFAELPERWSEEAQRAMSPEERTALLSVLMARHGGRVFSQGGNTDAWIAAVDGVVADLISEGVSPRDFDSALRERAGRDRFETERDTALSALYHDYVDTIAQHERCDGRDDLIRLAAAIERDHERFAARLGGRRDVRIVGLADLRGGWRQLLAALVASPALDSLTVFTTHALELPAGLRAETVLVERRQPRTECKVSALEAPDSARESEIVATRVRTLLDAGASPARIAVVAREARPMVDDIAAALEKLGVPVTARRRIALSCTGPARALHALLRGAAQGWPLHALIETAENPLLRLPFDREVLHALNRMAPLASPGDLADALSGLITRCRHRDTNGASGRAEHSLPDTARAVNTLRALQDFRTQVREMDESRSMDEWLAWTIDTLTGRRWNVDASLRTDGVALHALDVVRTDMLARDRIVAIAAAWRDAAATFRDDHADAGANAARHSLSAEAFLRVLPTLLAEDIVVQPDTTRGVTVSEALAAAWRGFDHVFIVGLSDGSFPSRPPRSPVLGDRDRSALIANGLPLDAPDAWRARERELFRVLCAAPRASLTLSWPATDGEGGEIVRSSYVDEFGLHDVVTTVPSQDVLTRDFPVVAAIAPAESIAHARRVSDTERNRHRALSPYNGAITEPALLDAIESGYGVEYTWSATSIEELAKCPWQWMAKRLLKLEERAEADDAIEPTTTGTILHGALERFFNAARERNGGRPVFLRASDAEWAAPLVERSLAEAWAEEGQRSWLGVPVLRGLARAELLNQLRKYIRFEMAHNEKAFNTRSPVYKNIRTGASQGELEFENVVIDVNGISFRLRGMIDRVDLGIDERVPNASSYMVAIDYKSSKGSTPAFGSKRGWDDGVVLQVPLYAEAIRQLFPANTLARLEYRTLRNPEIVHPLQFVKLDKADKSGAQQVVPTDAEQQFATALQHAARHIDGARRGMFPARPTQSCGCSPYCPARDACRIPGGPVEGMR